MSTHAIAQDAATLDEMKNQDVPDFTQKLRRVLAGKSRVDAAEACDTKASTLRGWLSQGTIPPPVQIAMLAEYAGCSVAYLCDDRIPVDADPKGGGGSVPLSDGELVARLRDRYIEEAERLHDYLDEIQGIDWYTIARRLLAEDAPRLLKGEQTGPMPPDIKRAADVLTAMRVLIPHTVGRFLPAFNDAIVDERLRFATLKQRMDRLSMARTVRVVMDLLPNLRGLSAAIAFDREGDNTGTRDLFEALRSELDEIEAGGLHFTETFAGVIDAGGMELYADNILEQVKVEIARRAKAREFPPEEDAVARAITEEVGKLVLADNQRQIEYEVKALQVASIETRLDNPEAPIPDGEAMLEMFEERAVERAVAISQAIVKILNTPE